MIYTALIEISNTMKSTLIRKNSFYMSTIITTTLQVLNGSFFAPLQNYPSLLLLLSLLSRRQLLRFPYALFVRFRAAERLIIVKELFAKKNKKNNHHSAHLPHLSSRNSTMLLVKWKCARSRENGEKLGLRNFRCFYRCCAVDIIISQD